MYKIIHCGKVIGEYKLFIDAWLEAVLNLKSYGKIIGPDINIIINPKSTN